jgi:hypothetical protein
MNPIPPISLVDESRLVAVVSDFPTISRRWREHAACAADLPSGLDTYFPEEGHLPPVDALALCLSCPVAVECLATALVDESRSGERFGWWGGFGPEEREHLAQRLGIETAPVAAGIETAPVAAGIETTPVELGIETVLVDPDFRGPAELARHLRSQNLTIRAIAAELGCTERTVYRYLADSAA